MNYLALTTLAAIGFLTASAPSIAVPDEQAQERQEAQSYRNLLDNQTIEAPEASLDDRESGTSGEALCPALASMKPGSWEYREALDRCQYGN